MDDYLFDHNRTIKDKACYRNEAGTMPRFNFRHQCQVFPPIGNPIYQKLVCMKCGESWSEIQMLVDKPHLDTCPRALQDYLNRTTKHA